MGMGCPIGNARRRRCRSSLLVFCLVAAVSTTAADDAPAPTPLPCPVGPRWSRQAKGVDVDGGGAYATAVCSNMGTCRADGICVCDSHYVGDACETLVCSPGGATGVNDCTNGTCALCAIDADCPYVETDYKCTRELLGGLISLPKPSKCSKKRARDCERDFPPSCACSCVECGTEADY